MADRLKDETDRQLESMFASEPVRDDGFSSNVMIRVRRRMWIRRLTLPAAIAVGVLLAAKPLVQVTQILPGIFGSIFEGIGGLNVMPDVGMVSLPTFLLGTMLLMGMLMIGRLLEE